LANGVALIPDRQQIEQAPSDRSGLEDAAVEQDRGRRQKRLRTGLGADQGAQRLTRLYVLEAAREKTGEMLADDGIRRVRQPEFLQARPPRLLRQIRDPGPGKEA